jgi:preprotein translocase subunit YajC
MMRAVFQLALVASPAFAEAGAAAPSPIASFMPIILIIGIFYLLIIRPQSKKFKAHQAMIQAVAKGDKVVTGGGIHGKVSKVLDDGTVSVEIAAGTEIVVEKSTLSQVKPKKDASEKPADAKASAAAKKKAANDNG